MKVEEIKKRVHGRVAARTEDWGALPGKVDAVELYPELDVRFLKPRRGFGAGQRLVWPLGQGVRLIVLSVFDAANLRLNLVGEAPERFAQSIKIRPGKRRGDIFAVCPITGEAVVKLVFRDGRFASRKAQRVVHLSQLSRPPQT